MTRTGSADHSFELPFDYSTYVEDFVISYKQGDIVLLNKGKEDIGKGLKVEGNEIFVELKPHETKLFKMGTARVQIKVKTPNGKVIPSDIIDIPVSPVLNEEALVDEI